MLIAWPVQDTNSHTSASNRQFPTTNGMGCRVRCCLGKELFNFFASVAIAGYVGTAMQLNGFHNQCVVSAHFHVPKS